MKLTGEQEQVVSSDARCIVVKALAGTGKTSTLIEFAKRRARQPMLYIVLTKSVQLHAGNKFRGTGVVARTSHSLAFQAYGKPYRDKLLNTSLKPWQISEALKLEDVVSGHVGRNGAMALGAIIGDTLNKFLYSASDEVLPRHAAADEKVIGRFLPDSGLTEQDAKLFLAEKAGILWGMMRDTGNRDVGMLHDGYLKLFAMSSPNLDNYSYLLCDEAQDLNPCTLNIINQQQTGKCFIGDSNQHLFGFRGARNALGVALKQGGVPYYLTGSFRFGGNIAHVANTVLSQKLENARVRGLGADDAIRRLDAGESFITLCRANATVFGETADAIEKGLPWFHVGGTPRYRFGQVLDVYWLSRHQKHTIKDTFIATFSNLDEYEGYADEAGDAEAMSRVRIVKRYGGKIPAILDAINARRGAAASEEAAVRLIANTHVVKGMEYDKVRLADDFIEMNELPDIEGLAPDQQRIVMAPHLDDLAILYVAVTRARKVLELNKDLLDVLAAGRQAEKRSHAAGGCLA